MIGIGKDDAFGIDKNLFKTRDERRLAEQVQQREQQVEVSKHIERVTAKDEVIDTELEAKARETVGQPREVRAPTSTEAPSAESSGLKGQELRP